MKKSAGILLYRQKDQLEFLLVHPGGPFWKNKDPGAWTIPKGEILEGEAAFDAALREFEEELGIIPKGNSFPLKPVKQKAGKTVIAWAMEGDLDPSAINPLSIEIEWPPRSGKVRSFPEIDKAGWFDREAARHKINPGQFALIEELEFLLHKIS
jgi:predicted NUDIX family NTP pyrophosphohydrolase